MGLRDPPKSSAFESDQFFQVLLRGGPADLLPIALAFALVLAVVAYAFGGVSGGHFNPAVTFSLAAVRRFPWTEVGPYMAAQIAGGIVGALLIAGVYGQDGAAFADVDILFGATTIAAGVSQWQALLAEALVTFVLVTAIMAVAIDPRGPKAVAGLIIGLSLGAGILMVGPITGASANFARSLGPIVASLLYETGAPAWGDLQSMRSARWWERAQRSSCTRAFPGSNGSLRRSHLNPSANPRSQSPRRVTADRDLPGRTAG